MTPYGRSAQLVGGPDDTGEPLALFRFDAYIDFLQLAALHRLALSQC